MGLIIDPANTINSTVVVESDTIHVPTLVCTDGSSSSTWEDDKSMDMSIYRQFSKQDDMKTLVYPDRVRTEFDLFLQYAEAKTLGSVDAAYDVIDGYLGSVGVNDAIIC